MCLFQSRRGCISFWQIGALAVGVVLGATASASATAYNVDIFGPLPVGVDHGPAGQAGTNYCSATTCAGGFGTAYSFEAQPGDTINFGTLTLRSFVFGDGRSMQEIQYLDENGKLQFGVGNPVDLFSGSLGVSFSFTYFIQLGGPTGGDCNSGNPACLASLQPLIDLPSQYDLTFTLPEGFIELGWTEPSAYTPPSSIGAIPEPSTWAMLLIGFAGIGFTAYCKERATRISADISRRRAISSVPRSGAFFDRILFLNRAWRIIGKKTMTLVAVCKQSASFDCCIYCGARGCAAHGRTYLSWILG